MIHQSLSINKEKNREKLESLDNTYIVSNKYSGKTRSHIRYVPKTLIFGMIVFPLMDILDIMPYKGVYSSVVFVVLCIIIVIADRIKVSPQGVKSHKQIFKWEEIKTIGIAVTSKGLPYKFYRKIIYISKKQYDKPIHISYKKGYYGTSNENIQTLVYYFERNFTPKNCLIIASFNRRLIHHIMAYWGTDIKNLEDTIGWHTYVRFYNFLHRKRRGNGDNKV